MLSITRPCPYEKRGDMIVPMAPTHYVTMFFGIEQRDADGNVIIVNGRTMYKTERLYVADGGVYAGENSRIPMDKLTELYPWFWSEYAKVSPELRKTVRLMLPEDRAQTVEALDDDFKATWESLPEAVKNQLAAQYAQPKVEEEMHTCPDCGDTYPVAQKNLHRAHKHRAAK